MEYNNWIKSTKDKLEWYDFAILKIGLIAFGLVLAKFYPPILRLDLFWYIMVWLIALVWLIYKTFGKKKLPEASN